jgi:hypothetical protein
MKRWTRQEDQLLLALINRHKNGDRISWTMIAPQFDRTRRSVEQRYHTTLKHTTKQFSLNLPTAKPARKKNKTKKTFLWGLYTVERES